MVDKTENSEPGFYRPRAEAQAQGSIELGRRLELTQKISAELRSIRAEVERLGELSARVGAVAEALKELAAMEQERNPKAGE